MTVSADRRGWGRGWPQNNSSKMVTVRAKRSGVVLSVHREIAPIMQFCLDTIEARGHLFDHGPKDVNDDWGYANRSIRGTSIPSNHSWGLAVDLDAQAYPQGQRKLRPPQWVDDIFAKYRFDNGAPWSNPDPMHYEFNGTPADARFLVASLAGAHVENKPPPMPPSAPVIVTPPPYVGPIPTQPRSWEDPMLVRCNVPGHVDFGRVILCWMNKTREDCPGAYYATWQRRFGPPQEESDPTGWQQTLSTFNPL